MPQGLPLYHPAVVIATWFWSGLLPRAPGTFGAFAALPFAWVFHTQFGVAGLLVASAVVFPVGWWSSSVYANRLGRQDPGPVVVDEVVAQWLTLAVVPPDVWLYLAGFVLFRAFDVLKPWPVSWADRRIKGGLGIMIDDLVAAAYAAPLLALLGYVMGASQ